MELRGGRGGMSSATGGETGLFNDAGGGGGNSVDLLPSQVNRLKSTGDIQRLTEHFESMHGGSGTEFAITIDKNGYATSYTAGGAGSVTPNGKHVAGALVVHNHPKDGWGNFSGEDLMYASKTKATGIVAVSRKVKAPANVTNPNTLKAYANRRAGQYTFTKGSHFKSQAFESAIKRLKVTSNDYDRGLGRWLEANQKKYGYKYSFKPAKG